MTSDSQSSSDAPLDLQVLAGLSEELGGSASLDFQETVESYIQDAGKRMADIQQAALLKEGERIREAAHSLRGSSAYVGARRLQALCAEIETLVREKTLDGISGRWPALQEEFERVRQALQAIGTHGPA
jgi:HPt (histidine-containing phosphotransfer) domain-containing protein